MIPTSVTGSSPPTACVGGVGSGGIGIIINNSPTIPSPNATSNGAGIVGGAGGQGNNIALLGIASLILEGRALAEDEYAIQTPRSDFASTLSGSSPECGRQSPKPSTSRAAFAENFGSGSSTSSYSNDIASYLRRKASNSPESTLSSSMLRDYYGSSSGESASSSVESNHSRWSQKLSQLRQESPSAHHHILTAREKIAVECPRSSDAEYVALAINIDHHNEDRRGDFEIIRRIALNRMNLYNSPSTTGGGGGVTIGGSGMSGGSGNGSGIGSTENFMCSLQSLASNTCLRVGNPLLSTTGSTSTPRFSTNRPRFPTPHQQLDLSAGSASSSGSGIQSPRNSNLWCPSPSSQPVNNKDYLLNKTSVTQRIAIPPSPQQTATAAATTTSTPINNLHSNVFSSKRETLNSTTTTPTTSRTNQTHPQQGPHCDQFLKKMGLAKGDASETEEHHCDMSYVNITCTRWRAYCIKMENILARGEPICIEVYLGPVGHKILLEQWIITQKEKLPPPTMTLPSLCSAIRSQLYFSQISAWCDLIKKSDKTIYETGRLIFTTPPITSAAGDLATTNNAMSTSPIPTTSTTTPSSSSSTSSSSSASSAANNLNSNASDVGGGVGGNGVGCGKRRPTSPRLNIFYRIQKYDSTACFNSKPNIHNFPNVNISENCSVSVCLKSLPRTKGGIPKVGTLTTTQQQQQQQHTPTTGATSIGISAPTTPQASSTPTTCLAAKTTKSTTNANKSTILTMNCDNNLKEHLQQQQKKLTATTTTNPNNNTSQSTSRSSASNGNSNSKQSSITIDKEDEDEDDRGTDFDIDQNIDINAGSDCLISSGIDVSAGDGGGDSSNSSFSTNCGGNLSHREKQLLKYRKRMMKRDKKHQQHKTSEIINLRTSEMENINNKMEQGEDEDEEDDDNENDEEDEQDVVKREQEEEVGDKVLMDNLHQQQLAKDQRQRLPNNHINSIPSTNQEQQRHHQQQQQQQQQYHVKMISTGTQTITNTCTSCGSEKSMICLKCNPLKNSIVAAATSTSFSYEEMEAESSSARSLSSSDIIQTPRNKAELLLQAIQRTPKSNKKHKKSKDLQQMAAIKQCTNTTNNTIAITNNNHDRNSTNNSNNMNGSSSGGAGGGGRAGMLGCQVCKRQKTQHNFSQPLTEDLSTSSSSSSEDNTSSANCSSLNASITACNSSSENKSSTNNTTCDDEDDNEGDNDTDGGNMLSSDCVDNISVVVVNRTTEEDDNRGVAAKVSSTKSCDNFNDNEVMEQEYFESSTKLTPHIDRCSLNTKAYYAQLQHSTSNGRGGGGGACQRRSMCSTPPLQEQTNNAANKEGSSMMAQFKTPTPSEQQQNSFKNKVHHQPLQPHKQTPKPNLLQIACNFNKNEDQQQMKSNNITNSNHNPLLLRRSLPKVNLTPIFCNPSSMMMVSSPIPIGNGVCNGSSKTSDIINITQASPTFSFESPSSPAPSLTVQKSNSAPTLPNSPSLSPRFVKASAIYKRRSRHLSDRSDRSSLGSDEQFSDEDIDSGMYSPFATSPVKLRTRLAAVFGRKPLLGNLEENLLQRRLVPKIEVMGFKLLLGASGGFCPTQLTIPAASYFYELKGETLSTPYLCEIRLPRKGYTVPRCGTVQATLLNPMGTVVRMFVIPYDMRDMPALHQTFIRQRILADSGLQQQQTNNNDNNAQNVVDKHFNDQNDNATINTKQQPPVLQQQQQRSPQCNNENHLGHFISAENMKSLRYSIHLRFQTSRSGRLMLHTDIRLLISRRTDCDTAAAHAKGVLEAPNELITNTMMPTNPKYSARQDQTSSKI